MIDVFIVDDHPLFIEGVIISLSHYSKQINVVGTANSSDEALKKLSSIDVDIIFLDLLMPVFNGAEFCKKIKETRPEIKVIVLTGELDILLLHEAWKNGADAIIMKYSGKDDLIEAIQEVNKGNTFFGKGLPNFHMPVSDSNFGKIPPLTRREKDVLIKLAQGHQRKTIADELFISIGGVNFHIKNIFKKFGVHTREELMEKAKKIKLIQ